MKRYLFIVMFLPAGGAMAQWETLPKVPFVQRPVHVLKNSSITKADTTSPDAGLLLKRKSTAAWLAQAKPSHATSQGKVYMLPIDNMPCLVPDKKKTVPMPGIRPVPDKRMPNAFRTAPMLPEGK